MNDLIYQISLGVLGVIAVGLSTLISFLKSKMSKKALEELKKFYENVDKIIQDTELTYNELGSGRGSLKKADAFNQVKLEAYGLKYNKFSDTDLDKLIEDRVSLMNTNKENKSIIEEKAGSASRSKTDANI